MLSFHWSHKHHSKTQSWQLFDTKDEVFEVIASKKKSNPFGFQDSVRFHLSKLDLCYSPGAYESHLPGYVSVYYFSCHERKPTTLKINRKLAAMDSNEETMSILERFYENSSYDLR